MTFKKRKISALLCAAIVAGASFSASAEMVFRKGNGAEPHSLDPQISEGVPAANILRDLFEGLTAEDQDGNIVPGMAESWEISEDGQTYTFHLREAVWSDGHPVTAEDVVYGWQRGVNPEVGSKYSFILYPIKNAEAITNGDMDVSELGAKAIDERTVEVQLEGPTPYFLGMLTHSVGYPVPKHIVEAHGKEWTRQENIVSNGPFEMVGWVPQSQIILEKSDEYWDSDVVQLDKVIYYPTEDQNSELKRYRAGELDWTHEVPTDQIKWIRANLADEFYTPNWLGTYYYGFNQSKPPFKDNIALREALTLAIDRDILTQQVTGAGEAPAYGFVVPGVTGYEPYIPEYAKLDSAERVARAQALYAEAGYSADKPLKVEILYNTSDNHKKVAIAVAAMWKQTLGVEASLTNQEWKVYLSNRREKNTEAFRAGWIGDYNDPNTFLELFVSNSGLNDVGFNSETFDKLLYDAAREQDLATRADMLYEAEKIFVDDFALMPIYHYVNKRLIKPYVKGYTLNVMDHNRSKYVYIEQ